MKLAAPFVSRSGGRSKASSAFNEGVSVPKGDWDALVKKNPALASKNAGEKHEAMKKEILHGDLAKYRRR